MVAKGTDILAFGRGEAGNDMVMDFHDNYDALDFTQYGFLSDAEVLSLAFASGNDTGLALADGNTTVLAGFDISQFDAEDFLI